MASILSVFGTNAIVFAVIALSLSAVQSAPRTELMFNNSAFAVSHRTYRVTSILGAPCLTKISNQVTPYNPTGLNPPYQAEYEGFCKDLLTEIMGLTHMTFTIQPTADNSHGKQGAYGLWTGMMGDLLSNDPLNRADLALADLAITYEREQHIAFTQPFMSGGISLVMRERDIPRNRGLYGAFGTIHSFMWIYIGSAQLLLCVLVYLMSIWRSSINAKAAKQAAAQAASESDPQQTEQAACQSQCCIFGLKFLIIWIFSAAALIAGFTLYTRNIIDRLEDTTLWESVAHNDNINITAVRNTLPHDYILSSPDARLRQLGDKLEEHDELIVENVQDGLALVRQGQEEGTGPVAMLLETSQADYEVRRDPNCELGKVGDVVRGLDYAIGVGKNDTELLRLLNGALLYLKEIGRIEHLINKWYRNTTCSEPRPIVVNVLSPYYWLDVLFVLAVGAILSLLVAIIEGIIHCARNANRGGKKSDTMLSTLEENKEDPEG